MSGSSESTLHLVLRFGGGTFCYIIYDEKKLKIDRYCDCCCNTLWLKQQIEKELGRKRKSKNKKYHDRPIDIDLLLCDDLTINTKDLTIPHPFMQERRFVLEPLKEIAPDVIHPVLHISISEMLEQI